VHPEDLIGLSDIQQAAVRIGGSIRRTPLVPTDLGREGGSLHLKAESLQIGGSFKLRGALNAMGKVPPVDLARGVISHSSGNHAQAVARAARCFGVAATVVMPSETPAVKLQATRALGADVVLVDAADRASAVDRIRADTGAVFIPPYDHRDVIAGQGTVGLEIVADLPDAATVYVPVSGGGLVSGIAVAVKARAPHTRVVAVEPELAGDLAEGWSRGERVVWDATLTSRTIADGLRVQAVGLLNWRHILALVDDVVTVSEDEIRSAVRRVVLEAKLVCEPSGAVAVAGYFKDQSRPSGGASVAVVSGGNVDPVALAGLLTASESGG
jgi:threonine dehydratase